MPLKDTASPAEKSKVSVAVPEPQQPVVPDPSVLDDTGIEQPGGSVMPEYERRSGDGDRRSRPSALSGVFNRRTSGERRAPKRVQELCGDDVLLLFNRKLGAGRRDGAIDIVAVGPAGVYVLDVKNYAGKKVETRISGGLFSQGHEQLFIGGKDCTRLAGSVTHQVDAVRSALLDYPGGEHLTVWPALCFVDADLPLFEALEIGGIPCLRPKAAAKLFSTPGPLTDVARTAVHRHLDRLLPPAR